MATPWSSWEHIRRSDAFEAITAAFTSKFVGDIREATPRVNIHIVTKPRLNEHWPQIVEVTHQRVWI